MFHTTDSKLEHDMFFKIATVGMHGNRAVLAHRDTETQRRSL